MISERATMRPQYMNAALDGMYRPTWTTHMSTLSGQTLIVIPLAKSAPVTQSSQILIILPGRMHTVGDILEPASAEQAKADYPERQLQHIGSITRSPPDMSTNGLTDQSQDETYRPQSRGTTPVIENVRVLMQVGFLCNRTVVVVVDKLSSTSVDFIRSERELEKLHLYGV